VERLEPWKLLVAELVEAVWCREVLQPVQAEATQLLFAGIGGSRRRDEDLTAVAGRGDTRGAMDVQPDVTLLRYERLSRVEPHADTDRPTGERIAGRNRRAQRTGCGRKGGEERVALRVDLDTAVRSNCFTNDAPVFGERLRVPLGSELLQEFRRACDVGEEERHPARRKFRRHTGIMHLHARSGIPGQHSADRRHAWALREPTACE
jgi:hypothetical protein